MDTENPYRSPEPGAADEVPLDRAERIAWAVRGYGNAIIVRRWAALQIDLVCLMFLYLLVNLVLGDQWHRKLLPLTLAGLALYHPLLEAWTGRTIGKLAVGVQVVDYAGNAPGFLRAFVRAILRLFEVNPFLLGGLPAGIVALISKHKQRLGDMLAGTLVVYSRDARWPPRVTIKPS